MYRGLFNLFRLPLHSSVPRTRELSTTRSSTWTDLVDILVARFDHLHLKKFSSGYVILVLHRCLAGMLPQSCVNYDEGIKNIVLLNSTRTFHDKYFKILIVKDSDQGYPYIIKLLNISLK